jgi:hypothetical protein
MESLSISFNVKHLHIESPFFTCNRTIIFGDDYVFDPGIGEMVVNPTTSVAYFRVR